MCKCADLWNECIEWDVSLTALSHSSLSVTEDFTASYIFVYVDPSVSKLHSFINASLIKNER